MYSTANFQHQNQERFQAYQRRKTLRGVKTVDAKYNTTNYVSLFMTVDI